MCSSSVFAYILVKLRERFRLPYTGVMRTGWLAVDGGWCYLDPATGAMQTGWVKINNTGWDQPWFDPGTGGVSADSYYYFGDDGLWRKDVAAPENGWFTDPKTGTKYYFTDGKMATGWVTIANTGWDQPWFDPDTGEELPGFEYYFGADGRLWRSTTTPDGKTVDENGRLVKGTGESEDTEADAAAEMSQQIDALPKPEDVTAGNAEDVRAKLEAIEKAIGDADDLTAEKKEELRSAYAPVKDALEKLGAGQAELCRVCGTACSEDCAVCAETKAKLWNPTDGADFEPNGVFPARWEICKNQVQETDYITVSLIDSDNGETVLADKVDPSLRGANVWTPLEVKEGVYTFRATLWRPGYATGDPAREILRMEAQVYIGVCAVRFDSDGGTAEGNPESYTVETGSFTLKNPARSGYTFTGWSGTGLNGENNMTVTVEAGSTGDRAYTAHWRQNAYVPGSCTILATVSGKGAISPSGRVSVSEGGSRTFTFTPDKGYALCNVLVDGKEIGAVESYTFKNVRSGHTIEAVFMEEDGNPKNGVTVSGKPSVTEKFKESTPEERLEKLEAARKANGDTVAWLYIPAAEIDVPVLQTENNAFYLRVGADKSYAPWGSVYADGRAELKDRETLSMNTAIFGASAENGDPDGECFSKLFRYLDAEFVEENPYIYLTLANGEELVFRIGACFITDTEFDYIRPELKTDKEWNEYLETVGKKNLFDITGGQLEKGDTLLTLTTYSAEYDTDKTGGQRFAVVAKLLPDGEDTAEYTVKDAENPELPKK